MIKVLLISLYFVLVAYPAFSDNAEFIYDVNSKRDPFIPLIGVGDSTETAISGAVNIGDIMFQGVAVDSAGNKVAILNGEIFKKGEKDGEVLVKDISDDHVILSIDGKDYKLELYEYE